MEMSSKLLLSQGIIQYSYYFFWNTFLCRDWSLGHNLAIRTKNHSFKEALMDTNWNHLLNDLNELVTYWLVPSEAGVS